MTMWTMQQFWNQHTCSHTKLVEEAMTRWVSANQEMCWILSLLLVVLFYVVAVHTFMFRWVFNIYTHKHKSKKYIKSDGYFQKIQFCMAVCLLTCLLLGFFCLFFSCPCCNPFTVILIWSAGFIWDLCRYYILMISYSCTWINIV